MKSKIKTLDGKTIKVWTKGIVIPGFYVGTWRRDIFGSAIKFEDYGNRESQHGWEIDHIVSVTKGGSDDISNLQPLQWENNAKKQNRL